MIPIIFIIGPTAVGKTETAFLLACQLEAEIISADSMLIYKEPEIITSKPQAYMRKEIPHHCVDMISVTENYNVFDYYASACAKITGLIAKKKPVIVCGGTGLYVKTILDGIFEGVGKDESLRKEIELRIQNHGKESVYEELRKIDRVTADKISLNDTRRVIRALEVYYLSGVPLSEQKKNVKGLYGQIPVALFGLRMPREKLYEHINSRVEEMIGRGAVEEVRMLRKCALSMTAEKIIGIKEISAFLNNECTLETAKENMKKNTRNFAKRQFTWFNADKRIEWIDVDGKNAFYAKGKILSNVFPAT